MASAHGAAELSCGPVSAFAEALLVGEVKGEDGGRIYVAGAVSDLGARFADEQGALVRLFVPIFLDRDLDAVRRFAETYVVLYRELWRD